jgi:hypothetical protein
MKTTIIKTLLYLFFGLIFMLSFSTFIYSIQVENAYVHYEEDPILHKINFYQENKNQINTLFVGTSRIYRQITPALFDSLNHGATVSYNAAYDNLRPYRTFDYIKYLEIDSSCKYLFIELIPPSRIGGNYNANPALFSIDYDKYFSIWDFSIKSNYPIQFKVYYLLRYSQAFFYKYLGFGLKKYIGLIISDYETELEPLSYSLEETRGFQPYQDDPVLNENVKARRKQFLQNPEQTLKTIIRQSKPVISKQIAISDAYIDDWLHLEKRLMDRNIEVFYIITPRRKPYDLAYIATMRAFVRGQVIDLSSPELYPSFYQKKYSFDEEHLNEKGAKIFTKELNNAFRNKKDETNYNLPISG